MSDIAELSGVNNRLRIVSSFLDSRILTKEYGKLFLQSPPLRWTTSAGGNQRGV